MKKIEQKMDSKIHIKNMVCGRCIISVSDILNELKIEFASINLGEVILKSEIDSEIKSKFKSKLESTGFELLEDSKSKIISQMKSIIINQIHYSDQILKNNYSTLLSQKLNHEYTFLSKMFSSVEGITVERFILKQKIERVKELIFYQELTLSEIAYQMDYSSVAHLSAQFKKETGMTPSLFKKLKKPTHRQIDHL
jgi:AraC-like DNA-binding protein